MITNVKIAVIAFIFVIAINITAVMVGFAGRSSAPVHTPGPSYAAMVTPTPETTVSVVPTETPNGTPSPAGTAAPDITAASTQTVTPTATAGSQPSVSATATATATAAPTATTVATVTPTATSNPAPTPTASAAMTVTPTATRTPAPTATPSPTPTPTPATTPTPAPSPSPAPEPTPAPTPTPTTPGQCQTTVSINSVSGEQQGNTFTMDININNVAYMAYGTFTLQFNSNLISYTSCNPASQIGGASGSVSASIIQSGLLMVDIDYSNYANAHGGNGISGSGYLCKLTFTATAKGTSQLHFSDTPPGELTLLKWVAYESSEIADICWTDSSITVY